jgi:hypothetical protein
MSDSTKTTFPGEDTTGHDNRTRVLRTAESLVNGDRNNQYGDPIQDFQRTADFWTIYLAEKGLDAPLLPHDVAAMMSLLKLSRIGWSPDKEDHWIDLAGYAACGADCVQRQR